MADICSNVYSVRRRKPEFSSILRYGSASGYLSRKFENSEVRQMVFDETLILIVYKAELWHTYDLMSVLYDAENRKSLAVLVLAQDWSKRASV